MKRVLKRIGLALAVLFLLVIIVVAGLAVWVHTDSGRARLVAQIERTVSASEDVSLSIGALEGTIPFDMTVRQVSVGDRAGEYLTIDRARVAWAPRALLQRTVHIVTIESDTIRLSRLPDGGEPEEDVREDPPTFEVPRLPVSVRLDQLLVQRLELAERVAGEEAVLRIFGNARVEEGTERVIANLSVDRLDKNLAEARLAADIAPHENTASINLTLGEPEGGLIARALDLPGLPPVSARLTGSGPIDAWDASLVFRGGDDLTLDAELALREQDGTYALDLDADARLVSLLDDDLLALAGETIPLGVSATLDPETERVDITRLETRLASGRVSATGSLDQAEGTVSLVLTAESGAADSLQALVPDVGWQAARLRVTLDGPMMEPAIDARLEADGITADAYGVETLIVDATARPRGPLTDPGSPIAFTFDTSATGLSGLPEETAGLVGTGLTLAAAGSVQRADGLVQLETLSLDAPGATLTGEANVRGWSEHVDARFDLSMEDMAVLSPLAGQDLAGRGRASVSVTGNPLAPHADLSVELADLMAMDYQLSALTINAEARPASSGVLVEQPVDIRLSAEALGLEGLPQDIASLLEPGIGLDGEVSIIPATGRIDLSSLSLTTPTGRMTASGTADRWGEDLSLAITADLPDLGRFSTLAGQGLAGATQLSADIERTDNGFFTADIDLGVDDIGVEMVPIVDVIMGERTRLTATLSQTAGGVRVTALDLDAATLGLTGTGAFEEGAVEAAWTLSVPDLGLVGRALDQPVAGGLEVQGEASGPLDGLFARVMAASPQLTFDGNEVRDLDILLTADDLTGRINGLARVTAIFAGEAVEFTADYALDEGEALSLADIEAEALGARLTGGLDVGFDGPALDGQLALRVNDLATLEGVAGQPLRGNLRADIGLRQQGGGQAADFDAVLAGFRIPGPDGPSVQADRITASGQLSDLFGDLGISADVTGSEVATPDATIRTLTASANGSLSEISFTADLDGDAVQPLDLALAGRFSNAAAGQRIVLDRLDGSYAGEAIGLRQPATIDIGADRAELDGLLLDLAGAEVTASGALMPSSVDADVSIQRLSLDLATVFVPDLGLTGTASVTASLSGNPADPTGSVSAQFDSVSVREVAELGLPGVDGQVNATLGGGSLGVEATITADGGSDRLDLTAAIPARFAVDPFAFDLAMDSSFEGSANGRLDLARFNDILAATGDSVQGRVDIALTAGGTLASPSLSGSVDLSNGRYENQLYGALITDMTARLEGEGSRLTVRSFQGRASNGGSISASGFIDMGQEGWPIDVRLTTSNARLLQIDLLRADVDSDLRIEGQLLQESAIRGTVDIREAQIRVPERMPPAIVELDVRERRVAEDGTVETVLVPADISRVPLPGRKPLPRTTAAERAAAEEVAATGQVMRLDIAVRAVNQVYVRGRGVDAELGGDLQVSGTTAAPRIDGSFTLRRGQISFLGQSIALSRGDITFVGDGSFDPILDLRAETAAGDVTAIVDLTGRASAPQIAISSQPELPQDEVLSRLLFNKATGDLSPLEAIQLAQGAAELAGLGGGPGILDRLRRSTGLDRLELIQDGEGLGSAGVRAGRYVSDRVYVGVEQGLDGDGSRVRVDVELTDNITVESDVGTDGDSRVGIRFQWDY